MNRSSRHGGYSFVTPHTLGLLLTMLLCPAIAFAQEDQEYDCKPDIKYECTADQCEKITSDFQHAESFAYSTKNGVISACLWTNCYAGKAAVFEDAASGSLTVIGRLVPSAHPGNKPIIVSLTMETSGNHDARDFTAIWGYRGDSLTFDMGKCAFRNSKQG